jgi:ribose 5-phosphate isomerase B
MAIGFGSDHWGVELKDQLLRHFAELGKESIDYGAFTSEPVDYPEIARNIALAVREGDIHNGVLICRTGLGMAIAANKVRGVFAATVHNLVTARSAAASNAAQIIALGADFVGFYHARLLISAWLDTPFKGGDSARKVGLIRLMESGFDGPVTLEQVRA